VIKYCSTGLPLYNFTMTNTLEFLTKSPESLISAAAKTAFVPTRHAVDACSGSVTGTLELAPKPASDTCCLWCGRTFTPRATGGSAQKFCCTGHRQQFWIAARRWTMRAIEAGLPEGVSRERARCPRGVPPLKMRPRAYPIRALGSECKISRGIARRSVDIPVCCNPAVARGSKAFKVPLASEVDPLDVVARKSDRRDATGAAAFRSISVIF
jgi:hypothetical protein